MKQRNTMKLWQMLSLGILTFALLMSMLFLPIISLRGDKIVDVAVDAVSEVTSNDIGKILKDIDSEDEESLEKAAEEIDRKIEEIEEKTGIRVSFISGIGYITMDTNALLLNDKDYTKEDLERAEKNENFVACRKSINQSKIEIIIEYIRAAALLLLIILGFFYRWSKYIVSTISIIFGTITTVNFAVLRWATPIMMLAQLDENDVTKETEIIADITWNAVVGIGVITCFILGILLLVMGIITCVVGKASAVSGGYSSKPAGPVFPPIDPVPLPPVPPVFIPPQPEPKPEPVMPVKPKSGRVKCTQGVAMGQGFKLPENRKVIVGKSPQNATLVIYDPHISNVHCSIRYREETDSYIVKDHSTNGTFVHGVRLEKDVAMEYPAGTVLSLADGTNKITLG